TWLTRHLPAQAQLVRGRSRREPLMVPVPTLPGGTEVAHPVTWFQISGKDGSALEAFYREIFDWKMSPSPDGSMQMVSPEKGGIAGGVGASRDGNSNVTVYANVDDIAAHLKKIQDSGGEVAMPPMELPEGMGWIAGFTDPAGNWVGLWQPGAQAQAP